MKKVLITSVMAALTLTACGQSNSVMPVEETIKNKEETKRVVEQENIEAKTEVNSEEEKIQEIVEKRVPTSPTTGMPVLHEEIESNHFAVMIENSPKSRPHSGLVSADIVYEMEVEGKITRFMALFNDEMPKKVGPVRSSRHYFVPLSDSWNMPYIHFGGSPQAYANLGKLEETSIDGIKQSKYFSRDNSRRAPHNAYLHTNTLPKFEEQISNKSFAYADESIKGTAVNSLEVKYNNFTHVMYKYDDKLKGYYRYLEGKPHKDRESGEQIFTNNIIFQYAKHTPLKDSSGRIDIDFSTQGKAIYFTNGVKVEGNWKNNNGNVEFYDNDGQMIKLVPGKTWIQVVDLNKEIFENHVK